MEKKTLASLMKKRMMVFFLGYSLTSHAYKMNNKRLMIVEEYVHVVYDETNHAEQNL